MTANYRSFAIIVVVFVVLSGSRGGVLLAFYLALFPVLPLVVNVAHIARTWPSRLVEQNGVTCYFGPFGRRAGFVPLV